MILFVIHTVLLLFMITTWIRLFHLEKILLTESGAWRSSNWTVFGIYCYNLYLYKLIIEDC